MRTQFPSKQTSRARVRDLLVGQRTRTADLIARVAAEVTAVSLSTIDAATFGLFNDAAGTDVASITATDTTLTCPENPWTAADVGKTIDVAGAGPAGAVLRTVIASFTSAGAVEIRDAATTTVAAAVGSAGGLAVWGYPPSLTLKSATLLDIAGAQLHSLMPAVPGGAARQVGQVLSEPVNVRDFGALGGVADDTAAVQAAIVAAGSNGTVLFPPGTFRANVVVSSRVNFVGCGNASVIKSHVDGGWAFTLTDAYGGWDFCTFRNLLIGRDDVSDNRRGIRFGGDTYVANVEYTGRWVFESVHFSCAIGVLKQDGNIGNRFLNCTFTCNRYGVYAYNRNPGNLMHCGADEMYGCHFWTATRAAYYVDSAPDGSGQLIFNGCIFENNNGFAFYCRQFTGQWAPGIKFVATWWESNALSGTATVNHGGPDAAGSVEDVVQLYLQDCGQATLEDTNLKTTKLVRSRLLCNRCATGEGSESVTKDADSVIVMKDARIDLSSSQTVLFDGVMTSERSFDSGFASTVIVPKRSVISRKSSGVPLVSVPFNDSAACTMYGSSNIDSTPVHDGMIYDVCQEFTIATGSTHVESTAFTTTAGKFYAITVDVKLVSGQAFGIVFTGAGSAGSALLLSGAWRTFCISGKASAATGPMQMYLYGPAAGSSVFRISAYQVVEFDTAQALAEFIANRTFVDAGRASESRGTAAPAAGVWEAGDKVWSKTPAAGGPMGWMCVISGTPGTWKAMPNLAP